MSFRHLLLCLGLSFAAVTFSTGHAEETAPDAVPTFGGAVGKNGATWENFYKFVVFIEDGKPARLVYQNMDKFELHLQYLATLPAFKGLSRDQIDGLTYRPSANRLAYTGVLVVHGGDDGIHRSRMSLAMEEAPTAELVAQIHALVKKSMGDQPDEQLGTAFDFEILPHQEAGFAGQIAALGAKGITVYAGETLGASVSYTEAWNTGVLVTVANQEELDTKFKQGLINQNSIVFAKEALREIPAVAGVISAVALTPASHTVLLAQMYGLPVAYFRNAEKVLAGLEGKMIFLNANGSPLLPMERRSAEISAEPSAADLAMLASLRALPQLSVPFNPAELNIRDVRELTQKDIGAYGGKASQMGALMRRLPQNSVAKALGIPLGFSRKFLDTALASDGQTLAAFIAGRLATINEQNMKDVSFVDAVTTQIQKEIRAAKFPAEDFKLIEQTVMAAFPGPAVKVRFRSTSNVEDGGEFNGAGLYDSEGVWLTGPKEDYVDKKLKKVISSLYNSRAYLARRKFGVDESKVGMGILVHPAFTGETGNGVIRVIVDQKREYFRFEAVTLKGGDEQVTHASGAGAAEVLTGMGDYASKEANDNFTIEQPYEGYSKQRSLFPAPVYKKLGAMMAEIAREYDEAGRDIDIESEFKVMTDASGNNEVFIKQVRRVPHPAPRLTADGSRFIVLAKSVTFRATDVNLGSAYGDLWLPKKVEFEMDTFTEAQIRAGRVTVKSAVFEIRGKRFALTNPKVAAKIYDGNEGYSLKISLPNDYFPSLTLEISNSGQQMRVHAITSAEIYAQSEIAAKDLKILVKAGMKESISGFYDSKPATEAAFTSAPFTIEIAKRGGAVQISSAGTKIFGEGDGHSVRMGRTTITGLWKRPLQIPSEAIGYGANHHQGDESFVIDLFADATLTARDRANLGGRYLYLLTEGYAEDGSRALLIKENGETKKLGTWTSK